MTIITEDVVAARLTGQRIALVGGAGFIGHNLALKLRSLGADVAVIDNLMVNSLVENVFRAEQPALQRQLYQNFLLDRFRMMRETGVKLINCDARIHIDLSRALEECRPTKIVHLSAISSAVDAGKNPGLCFDLQLVTLRNVLEWARFNSDVAHQIMFLSSSTVYGDFETDSVDETVRPRPKGIYANAKYMGERLLRTYRDSYGLGTTTVRPSALYGERCVSRRVSQVFIENALSGKPLPMEGGGDGRLDFTYIEDLTDGMARALAMHAGPEDSSTFNLTLGNARTIAELVKVVCDVVPGAVVEDRPRAAHKPIRGTLLIDRARDKLGFNPSWTLETGYRRYCEWYAEQWAAARRQVGE